MGNIHWHGWSSDAKRPRHRQVVPVLLPKTSELQWHWRLSNHTSVNHPKRTQGNPKTPRCFSRIKQRGNMKIVKSMWTYCKSGTGIFICSESSWWITSVPVRLSDLHEHDEPRHSIVSWCQKASEERESKRGFESLYENHAKLQIKNLRRWKCLIINPTMRNISPLKQQRVLTLLDVILVTFR